ncbi:hypothetical protein ZWY2020_036706 [Hordeum vulgare]|nr:hypothetical protein ZWY2020_036706 [Hordeum vulgare]
MFRSSSSLESLESDPVRAQNLFPRRDRSAMPAGGLAAAGRSWSLVDPPRPPADITPSRGRVAPGLGLATDGGGASSRGRVAPRMETLASAGGCSGGRGSGGGM